MQFFSKRASLEGHNSFKMLRKKNYKILHTLQTKAQISPPENPYQFESRSRTFCKQMKILSKTLKYSQEIQLHEALEYYRRNEMYNIIKRFKNIKSLSLDLLVTYGNRLVDDSVKWLMLLKRLSKLWIALGMKKTAPFQNIQRRITSPHMLEYFLRKLPQTCVPTLKLSFETPPEKNISELLFSKVYSSKIKNLFVIHEPTEEFHHIPLANEIISPSFGLQNLRSLHLSALMSAENLTSLLARIERPEILKSLQLKPYLIETNQTPNNSLLEALSKFQNLKSLNLNLIYWKGDVAKVFELLNTATTKLTNLKMNFTATKFKDLSKLADALGNLTLLKRLSLRVRSPKVAGEDITEVCTSLFQNMAELNNLQRLKLFFRTDYMMSRENFDPDQLLPILSESLLQMQSLGSFSFDFYNFIHSHQWTNFFRTARPILINLKTLKINFKGEKLLDEDYDSFLYFLQDSNYLCQLSLTGFHFTLLELFEKMANCLLKMKCLTRLSLNEIFGKLERTQLARLLNQLLAKPGFKEFKSDIAKSNQYIMKQAFHRRDRVNLESITNRNFSLEKAYTPLDVFLGTSDVAYWKWL